MDLECLVVVVMVVVVVRTQSGRAFGKRGSTSRRMFFFPLVGPGWMGMNISVRL